jgi:hypothetical protein
VRILIVIESYGTANDVYLRRLVEEYRSMSFETEIVVLSNIPKAVPAGAKVQVVRRRSIPWRDLSAFKKSDLRALKHEYKEWRRHMDLPFAHKQIFAEHLDEYDLFIYSEDDTLVTERNIRAFLGASDVLLGDEIAGFFRFEETPDGGLNYPEVHGPYHWDTASVCRRGKHTFAFFTNEHAACYVATRDQLRRAI